MVPLLSLSTFVYKQRTNRFRSELLEDSNEKQSTAFRIGCLIFLRFNYKPTTKRYIQNKTVHKPPWKNWRKTFGKILLPLYNYKRAERRDDDNVNKPYSTPGCDSFRCETKIVQSFSVYLSPKIACTYMLKLHMKNVSATLPTCRRWHVGLRFTNIDHDT